MGYDNAQVGYVAFLLRVEECLMGNLLGSKEGGLREEEIEQYPGQCEREEGKPPFLEMQYCFSGVLANSSTSLPLCLKENFVCIMPIKKAVPFVLYTGS